MKTEATFKIKYPAGIEYLRARLEQLRDWTPPSGNVYTIYEKRKIVWEGGVGPYGTVKIAATSPFPKGRDITPDTRGTWIVEKSINKSESEFRQIATIEAYENFPDRTWVEIIDGLRPRYYRRHMEVKPIGDDLEDLYRTLLIKAKGILNSTKHQDGVPGRATGEDTDTTKRRKMRRDRIDAVALAAMYLDKQPDLPELSGARRYGTTTDTINNRRANPVVLARIAELEADNQLFVKVNRKVLNEAAEKRRDKKAVNTRNN